MDPNESLAPEPIDLEEVPPDIPQPAQEAPDDEDRELLEALQKELGPPTDKEDEPSQESAENEDGLFVPQLGEIRPDRTEYDLTEETEEESAARWARVTECYDLTGEPVIKKEPIDNRKRRPTPQDGVLSNGEQESPRKRQRISQGATLEQNGDESDESDEALSDDEILKLMTEKRRLEKVKKKSYQQFERLSEIVEKLEKVEKAMEREGDQDGEMEGPEDEMDKEIAEAIASQNFNIAPEIETRELGNETGEPTITEGGNVETTEKKKRRPIAKTAREYWERKYAENQDPSNPRTLATMPRQEPTPRKGKNVISRQDQLEQLLQQNDPIMARAAKGDMQLPGPIQATKQKDQLRAMNDFLFKIGSNPSQRHSSVDMKLLKEAVKSFGFRKLTACDGKWALKPMATTLYNHQVLGVSWMLGQEFSPNGPFGGILADDMGLGKTVQILATMAANQPTREEIRNHEHLTLIVAPASAISQWISEIKRHCNPEFIDPNRIKHYKASRDDNIALWLATASIVIVSYQEVARAFPSQEQIRELGAKNLKGEAWEKEMDKILGPIFSIKWRRVVLDEGHSIRNANSRTSRACVHLTSKYRWILTGTPLHNSVDELFAYFRFLGAHWAADYQEFRKQFGDISKEDVQERLTAVVRGSMLRRRVDDMFLGVPILQIPKTNPVELVWVDLTTEERLIYQRLKERYLKNINSHVKELEGSGDTGKKKRDKKLRAYVVFLTRLRQAVAHPYLLEGTLSTSFNLEDLHWLRSQLKRVGGKIPAFEQVQAWVEMEFEKRSTNDTDPTSFGQGTHGYSFNLDPQLERMESLKGMNDVFCRICHEIPQNPRITECGHAFCRDCIDGELMINPERCPDCNGILLQLEDLHGRTHTVLDNNQDASDSDSDIPRGRKGRKKKKQIREVGDDVNMWQPKLTDKSSWIKDYDRQWPNATMASGAKTVAVKNQVLKWQSEAPEDKIIIFVEFSKLGNILGRILMEENIDYLHYCGEMSPDQKNAAVDQFRADPSIKVLIASIKCGGQSLNLTCANRIITVDQWWNRAVEDQAHGRVHRIGQEKETFFVKILAKGTIDERIFDLQEKKAGDIKKALQEGVKYKKPPTLEEMCDIFGEVAAAENETGEVIVIQDDDDDRSSEAVEDNQILDE
ncbi:81e4ad1c-ff53-4b31-96ff-86feb7e2e2d8 [Naviculisporaceae sp. PSN 640]